MKYTGEFRKHIKEIFERKIDIYDLYRHIELELTNKCGNACFYCGVSESHNEGVCEIDFEDLKEFLDKISFYYSAKNKRPVISLAGGDPILYANFDELVSYLKERNLLFTIKGNPSTINHGIVESLRNYDAVNVRFTCLGGRAVHDRIRGKDTTEELKSKTKLLKSDGIPVNWNLTVGNFNIESITDALPLVMGSEPDFVVIGRVARIGRLRHTEFSDITPLDYKKLLSTMLDFYYQNYRKGFRLGFKEKLWIPLLAEESLFDPEEYETGCPRLGCYAYGPQMLNVNHKGDIGLCGLMPCLKIGNVRDTDNLFHQLEDCRILSPDASSPCHICRYTNFCRGCRAMASANTGGLYNQDPQCWLETPL
ncbi:radical SAM protein [Desulfonema magnum]|uniref:Radical SAM domain-containing protein n=1 Tax=Desulfonema magnum TaxID=45655 RepID=A0A975BPF3_9BACT|nr:radical SAM protein [Desulfonema magnum]QTA89211.1 Radical SAM domain-containing protein [Desulfonema magnum]